MTREYPTDWNSRRKEVYKRDNYTCQNCGAQGGNRGNAELHAHHIVPKSKGGTHQISNLKTICSKCHKAVHGSSMAPTSSAPNDNSSFWDRLGDIEPEDIDEFIEQNEPDDKQKRQQKKIMFVMAVCVMVYIFTYIVTDSIQTTTLVGFITLVSMVFYFGPFEPE
jgi:ribosomal protein L37AE/L43A